MASQIQLMQYEGYMVADPILRFTPSGREVCNFRMGSTREWKSADGEKQRETVWLKVTAWGALANIVNMAKKGAHVIVFGRLTPNKETGSPTVYQLKNLEYAASFEVTADNIRLITFGSNKEGAEMSDNDIDEYLGDTKVPF